MQVFLDIVQRKPMVLFGPLLLAGLLAGLGLFGVIYAAERSVRAQQVGLIARWAGVGGGRGSAGVSFLRYYAYLKVGGGGRDRRGEDRRWFCEGRAQRLGVERLKTTLAAVEEDGYAGDSTMPRARELPSSPFTVKSAGLFTIR